MPRIPVYILAGGRSSRFGADKARLELAGVSMLDWAASQYLHLDPEPRVIADRLGKYEDLGYTTLADLQPGRGPAGGLAAALSDCRRREGHDGWLLIAACDRLGIREEWLERLLSARRTDRKWVAFRDRHWQPLPSLVHCRQKLGQETALWRIIEAASPLGLDLPRDWDYSADFNDPRTLGRVERQTGTGVDRGMVLPLHRA